MMFTRMLMRGYRPGQTYAQSANSVVMMLFFIVTFLPYCLGMFVWGITWPVRYLVREIWRASRRKRADQARMPANVASMALHVRDKHLAEQARVSAHRARRAA